MGIGLIVYFMCALTCRVSVIFEQAGCDSTLC